MKRAVIAVLILALGIAIGCCLAVSRGGTRPAVAVAVQDWRPVVGRRYERPGSHARTVTEVWPGGVGYRRDNGKERYCTIETWRRWVQRRGE
jgi:hypothetical protein